MAVLAAALVLPACSGPAGAVPECEASTRLALVAQSIPEASYVPCIQGLGEDWSAHGFNASRGSARFTLVPHRAGSRPVKVAFEAGCDLRDVVPTTPRAEGVRTSVRLTSISPRYSGTLTDAFPGGCVTYRFDFPRGPHIALMEQLSASVGLFPRRQLRLELQRQLGVELEP